MATQLQKLGKDVFLTFLRHLLSLILGLAIAVLLARVLGAEGNGIYGMALLLPTMAATFLNLGLGPSNVFFLAAEKVDIHIVLKNTLQLWVLLSIVGVVTSYLFVYFFANTYFPGVNANFLKLSIWIFPLTLLNTFLVSVLQGMRDFKKFNLVALITPLANFLFAIGALLIFKLNIEGAILAYLFGQFTTILVLVRYLPEIGKIRNIFRIEKYASDSLTYAFKTHLSNMLSFINYRADLFLINFFLGPLFTGIYLVAVQITERAWILSQVVSTVLLPYLADLKEDEALRLKLTPFMARSIFLVTLLGSILMGLLAQWLIDVLFGDEFQKATRVLLWLLPGICFGSVSRVYANDISARGKPELNFYAAIVVVLVNIGLNLALIPKFGLVGGAWATSVAYLLNMVLKIGLYIWVTNLGLRQILLPNQIDRQIYELIKKKMSNG
ncbi:MAG: flippase [Cyclobacteriaceae bacterium]